MKKAKIFLTALTVLTVVGGAFAFKVKTEATFARTCNVQTHLCTLDTFTTLETTISTGQQLTTYELFGKPCKPGNVCRTFTIISE